MYKILIRDIESTIMQASKSFKSITILGPRQTGKTTLAKTCFSNYKYFNFENPDTRELALADPRAFLKSTLDGAIFDEIQRVPELLSYAQEILDNTKKKCLYIFTGSNQLDVHKQITQTLAGRTAIFRLLPFSLEELKSSKLKMSVDEMLYTGFYPGVYSEKQNPTIAYRSYYETYIEKDLRSMLQVKDLRLFQKFMKLCAGRIGQLFNASSLANETGVSVPTIQHWISILQSSNMIFLLEPFHANISKRLVKSPKLYFTDTGFASYLLGIENENQISRDPLRGQLFENMVIIELLKSRYNKGLDPNMYFYRDNHQNEVDCLIKTAKGYEAIEIKSAETFNVDFLKGLEKIKKTLDGKISRTWLVYAGKQEQISEENHSIVNFNNLIGQISDK